MTTVPFYDYTHTFCSNEKKLLDVIADVGRRGAFIMQKDLQEFEEALESYIGGGCRVVGVGNATDAMEMYLAAYDIGPGNEVLVSAHTMIATASAIAAVGATPVAVDIGTDKLMDVAAAAEAINGKTRALIITQLNGATAAMEPFVQLCSDRGILLFEDSAQGLGSMYKGQAAGTFGLAGCLSFYPAKVLGSLGDGGAIICNDHNVVEKFFMMRDHGRGSDGDVHLWGRNSRLDNLQAAILHYFLRDFDQVVFRRREIARIYETVLSECSELVLPERGENDDDHFNTFQNYEIEAERRDELRAFLASRNVGTIIQWGGKAINHFPKLDVAGDTPCADRFFERCLLLPMNTALTDNQVQKVGETILEFYSKSGDS